MNNDVAISVENLTKKYGDLMAVNDVSFDVKRGEIFGQAESAVLNTVLISVMGVIAIIVGSLITKWEDD